MMGYGNMSINDYCEKAYKTGVEHGWYENGQPNVGERLMLIVSEIAEAMEFYRDGRDITILREHELRGIPMELFHRESDAKPDGFWIEIADAVIRIFDFAGAYGINLEYLVNHKMGFNDTRPYKHGKIV